MAPEDRPAALVPPPPEGAPAPPPPDRLQRQLLCGLAIAWVIGFTALAWHQWTHYWTRSMDMTLYWEALHRFARGSAGLTSTWNTFLGHHAHWVHFLLTPLAWTGSPLGLFLLQAASVAGAALALHRYAARRLPPWPALLLAAAWLLQPLTQAPVMFDYHPEVLGVAALAWGLVALDERRPRACALAFVWVAATKETSGLVVLAAAPLALRARQPRLALFLLGLGLVAFLGGRGLVALVNRNGYAQATHLYASLGATLPEVAWNLVRHPLLALDHLTAPGRMRTVSLVLGSALFLPLLRPWHLVPVAPLFLLALMADLPRVHDVRYHYLALPMVGLGFATADALAGVAWARQRALPLAGGLLGVGLLLHPLPLDGRPLSPVLGVHLWRQHAAEAARRAELDAVVAGLPAEGAVAATLMLAPHLADRDVYLLEILVNGYPGGGQPPFPDSLEHVIVVYPQSGEEVGAWLRARHGAWHEVHRGPAAWAFRRDPPAR